MTGPRGHPLLGAIAGFFAFTFLGTTLLFLGVVPLDSSLLGVLPFLGIVAGTAWGWWAPLGRRAPKPLPVSTPPPPAAVEEPPPPPAAVEVPPPPPAAVEEPPPPPAAVEEPPAPAL